MKIPQDVVDFDSTYEKNGAMHIALNSQTVELQIGISYISHQMALESIERDLMGKSFDDIKAQGAAIWEERLSRIEIDTDDEAQKRTFYSCLYRTFLFPHKAYEIDKDGNAFLVKLPAEFDHEIKVLHVHDFAAGKGDTAAGSFVKIPVLQ